MLGGFWGHLLDQGIDAGTGYMRGQTAGEAEQRQREIEEENRARQRRADEQNATIRDLQIENARTRPEKVLKGSGGVEFPATPQGQQQLLEWEKKWSAAGRAPDRANTRERDPIVERERSREYWQKIAEDLVAESGGDPVGAAHNAQRLDRPQLRAAWKRRELTPEMLHGAASRRGGSKERPGAPDSVLRQLDQQLSGDLLAIRKALIDAGYDPDK